MKEKLQEALTACLVSGDTAPYIDTAKELLEKSDETVDPTDSLTWGWFAVAVCNNRTDVAQLLIEKGLLANAIEDEIKKKTPLHIAAYHGDDQTAAYLADNGADILAKDAKGRTAADIANHKGHKKVVRLLEPNRAPSPKPDSLYSKPIAVPTTSPPLSPNTPEKTQKK